MWSPFSGVRDEATKLGQELDRLRQELASMREVVAGLRQGTAELRGAFQSLSYQIDDTGRRLAAIGQPPPAPPIPGPDGPPEPLDTREPNGDGGAPTGDCGQNAEEPKPEEDDDLLKALKEAAGVAKAKLICHQDTWAFIAEQAGSAESPHFRVSGDIKTRTSASDGTHDSDNSAGSDADILEVAVSGRSLVAILAVLHGIQGGTRKSVQDRAIAGALYGKITGVLKDVGDHVGGPVTEIRIDDRPEKKARENGEEQGGEGDAVTPPAPRKPAPAAGGGRPVREAPRSRSRR